MPARRGRARAPPCPKNPPFRPRSTNLTAHHHHHHPSRHFCMRRAVGLVHRISPTASADRARPRARKMASAALATPALALPRASLAAKLIATHSGSFHCDEALGCYLLRQTQAFEGAGVLRTRDAALLATADVVIDVGGTYDPGGFSGRWPGEAGVGGGRGELMRARRVLGGGRSGPGMAGWRSANRPPHPNSPQPRTAMTTTSASSTTSLATASRGRGGGGAGGMAGRRALDAADRRPAHTPTTTTTRQPRCRL